MTVLTYITPSDFYTARTDKKDLQGESMSIVLDKTTIAEVKVITRPSCQPCKATLRKFGSYDLTIVDSAINHDEAISLAASVGYASAPVVLVYDQEGTIIDHWSGFNPDRINAVLAAN